MSGVLRGRFSGFLLGTLLGIAFSRELKSAGSDAGVFLVLPNGVVLLFVRTLTSSG